MTGYAHLACWVLAAGVLLTSAASKLHSRAAFDAFADSVRQVQLLPPALVRPAAAAVALAEAVTVALLAVPAFARAGFVLAAALLLAFTAVVAVALARGIQAPCRCFGASARPYSGVHLVRNALLLAAVAYALWSSPPATYEPGGVAVSVFAAVAGGLVLVFLVDFVSLFRPAQPPAGPTTAATRRTHA